MYPCVMLYQLSCEATHWEYMYGHNSFCNYIHSVVTLRQRTLFWYLFLCHTNIRYEAMLLVES